jgi:uncharacterized protein YecT (DUF1311 family)
MKLTVLALLATLIATGAAYGASFDCGKAASPVERAICADPALSKADDALAAAYRAALSATLDPVALRRDQRQWRRERDLHQNQSSLLTAFQSRIAALNQQAGAWHNLSRDFVASKIAGTCFVTPEADDDLSCQVGESGTVAGDGGLRYQLQDFYQDKLFADGGAVVFAAKTPTALTPVVTAYGDTTHFGRPKVFTAASATFLLIPGHMEGTGNFNAEQLYLSVGGAWHDVDSDSWLAVLAGRLPKDLAALQGIYPDYQKMTATTPLWTKADGNCCPTGGRADITLRLVGTTLTINTLKVTLGADAAQQE